MTTPSALPFLLVQESEATDDGPGCHVAQRLRRYTTLTTTTPPSPYCDPTLSLPHYLILTLTLTLTKGRYVAQRLRRSTLTAMTPPLPLL